VLADLFLHYAFDTWMAREYPGIPFERYADDGVVHCESQRQAREVLAAIANRMEHVGLRLHPGKTKVVYSDAALLSTRRLPSSGLPSTPARHAAGQGGISLTSCPRSARMP
jgi:retron-type reverse transcriptase